MEHLVDRIHTREIDADALQLFAAWLNTAPEVPESSWYKRFPGMTVSLATRFRQSFGTTPGARDV